MACVLLLGGVYTLVKWHRAHFWLFQRTWIFAEALFAFLWERVKPVCLPLRPVLGVFFRARFGSCVALALTLQSFSPAHGWGGASWRWKGPGRPWCGSCRWIVGLCSPHTQAVDPWVPTLHWALPAVKRRGTDEFRCNVVDWCTPKCKRQLPVCTAFSH